MKSYLYMTVLQNLPKFADMVEESMDSFIASRSFKDSSVMSNEPIDTQVFASIAGVLHEYVALIFHSRQMIHPSH
jgi:ABC-type amino acid transport system permease subunit